ncbi:MAG: MarR family winged helix-turn-helix transcriptional regulator [Candidatus Entotheonellia bacterium]
MRGQPQADTTPQNPLRTIEEEAFFHLLHTADTLFQGLTSTLKTVGLSPSQYDLLQILRGGGADGLACRAVAERMLTRDPDTTRLLDRLEARGLVTRAREGKDRRVVTTRITPEGVRLTVELDAPIAQLHQRQLGHMGKQRLRALIRLLEMALARAR